MGEDPGGRELGLRDCKRCSKSKGVFLCIRNRQNFSILHTEPLYLGSRHHTVRELRGLRGPDSFETVLYMTIAVGDASATGLWVLCCCVGQGWNLLLFHRKPKPATYRLKFLLANAWVHAMTHCETLKTSAVLRISKLCSAYQ